MTVEQLIDFLTNADKTQAIVNLMAIASFIFSCISVCKYFLLKRLNVHINIHDYATRSYASQFYVTIENRSQFHIYINKINIINNQKSYTCELLSKKIRDYNKKLYTTPMFPIDIGSNQHFHCYLEFLYCQDISLVPQKKVVFQICTNHGNIKKHVKLGNTSDYLHKK